MVAKVALLAARAVLLELELAVQAVLAALVELVIATVVAVVAVVVTQALAALAVREENLIPIQLLLFRGQGVLVPVVVQVAALVMAAAVVLVLMDQVQMVLVALVNCAVDNGLVVAEAVVLVALAAVIVVLRAHTAVAVQEMALRALLEQSESFGRVVRALSHQPALAVLNFQDQK